MDGTAKSLDNWNEATEPEDAGLGRNIVTMGWVAFFGGLAQDMIQPILPLFYTTVLGLSKEFVGLIEGLLTTVVSISRIGDGLGKGLKDAPRDALVATSAGQQKLGRQP